METNFSNELKNVLDQSRIEAMRHNSATIKAEHILLAIMSQPDCHGFAAMQKIVGDHTLEQMRLSFTTSLFESPGQATEIKSVSDLANRIIKLSVLEARMLKSNVVDSEHMLLAIFHNTEMRNSDIIQQMNNAGITYEKPV